GMGGPERVLRPLRIFAEAGYRLRALPAFDQYLRRLRANQVVRRAERADRVLVLRPLGRVEAVRDLRPVLADILQPPDAAGHVALVVAAVPVGHEQVAVGVEQDVTGAEVRIGAAQQRFLRDDVTALVWHEAEDPAVRPGEAVRAPVAEEQVPL